MCLTILSLILSLFLHVDGFYGKGFAGSRQTKHTNVITFSTDKSNACKTVQARRSKNETTVQRWKGNALKERDELC